MTCTKQIHSAETGEGDPAPRLVFTKCLKLMDCFTYSDYRLQTGSGQMVECFPEVMVFFISEQNFPL